VVVLFGVSEGEGPFREVCYKGDRPDEYPEYLRLKYPTWANPYFPKEALALASGSTPRSGSTNCTARSGKASPARSSRASRM
jgi:hypothetical protein